MTIYDILFWLIIVMIALLAFAIETGIAARHRRVVVSSILAATLAAVYMMFLVEDSSDFAFEPPPKVAKKAQKRGAGLMNESEDGEATENADETGGDDQSATAGADSGSEEAARTLPSGPFRDCESCPPMVPVEPGTFVIATEQRRSNGEPASAKRIAFKTPYAIGQFEVTRQQFSAFVDDTGHRPSRDCRTVGAASQRVDWRQPGFAQTDRHPVVCVSYLDAAAYVEWLTTTTGRAYRLPSEAEWEFAARAGTEASYATGDRINVAQANFGGSNTGTVEIGGSKANDNRMYDVHGNVWEITADCWTEDVAFIGSDGGAVRLLGDCARRAIRGGAFDSDDAQVKLSTRGTIGEDGANNTVGFRVARD